MTSSGPLTDRMVDVLHNSRAAAIQSLVDGESDESFGAAIQADALIRSYGLPIVSGSEEYGWLLKEYKVAFRDFSSALLTKQAAFTSYDFAATAAHSVGSRKPVKTYTIRALVQAYSAEKATTDSWAPRTKLEKADHFNLLADILDEQTDVGNIGAQDMNLVKSILQRYPKNRSKNPLTRGQPLDQVLKMVGLETIQVPTINKYLQSYNDLFSWANKNGLVERNWFHNIALRQKQGEQKRTGYSALQIRRIEATVTGTESFIKKDYQKWGPLIGIYSGARLNEIAQLHLSDIRSDDGIWCIDVNKQGEKQLKTLSAERLVPIHQKLLEHGFLAHVDAMRERGHQRLFPDFPFSINNGYGRNLGRWFNEKLLPHLEIKTGDLVFHSLRHTFITGLLQRDVPEPIVKALVGHAREGVTQKNYFKSGYKTKQLQEALEKLDFSVDSLQPINESMQIKIDQFGEND